MKIAFSIFLLFVLATGLSVRADAPKPMRVVAQFNEDESDEIRAGLKNLKNALAEATKEKTDLKIKVVFFGGGLKTLSTKKDLWKLVDGLSKTNQVEFEACQNTMAAMGIKQTDLPPEFTTVGSGAFEVMKLERLGYIYFRP